jgi:hypothetical protein
MWLHFINKLNVTLHPLGLTKLVKTPSPKLKLLFLLLSLSKLFNINDITNVANCLAPVFPP